MKLGLYCNWGLKKYNDIYYIPAIHKNYIDVFKKYTSSVVLLSKVIDEKPSLGDIKIEDIEILELSNFNNYLDAIKYFIPIAKGLWKLIRKTEFIYIRVPEPFSWVAGVLNIFSNTTLHYHYVSNPIDVIKGYKANIFIKYLKICVYLPEYYLTAFIASFNRVSCIGNSGKKKLPLLLRKKVLPLYESSYKKDFVAIERKKPFYLAATVSFLYVGRLVQSKGLEEMIESISIFKDQTDYKFKISIVGDGNLRTKIEALVKEKDLKNEIIFLGAIPFGYELDKIYSENDVLISPSFSEAGPRTVLEASINSMYVISTDVGFVKEIFYTKNDKLCSLVSIGCVSELVKAYKFVFENKELCYQKTLVAKEIVQTLTLDKFIKNILTKEKL